MISHLDYNISHIAYKVSHKIVVLSGEKMRVYLEKTDARDVTINGESLQVILAHYYALPSLIGEVRKPNGNFDAWDKQREHKTPFIVKIDIIEKE